MRFTIQAPRPDFSGEVAGVYFRKGRGLLDTSEEGGPAALGYFQRRGYSVEQLDDTPAAPADPNGDGGPGDGGKTGDGEGAGGGPDASKRPARAASKADWQAYARSLVKDSEEEAALDGLTKEQLIEQYGGDA